MSSKKTALSKAAQFILSNVGEHASDIVSLTSDRLKISRQTAHKHVSKLVMQGKLTRIGKTNAARYYLNTEDSCSLSFDAIKSFEWDVWKDHFSAKLSNVPENIRDICSYGFTEIFNNAIDHSGSKQIRVTFTMQFGSLEFEISDDGLGVFKKIQDYYKLPSIREAILRLSKGKVTTDPTRHSGEGIFFTSRMFDEFSIFSNDMYFKRIEKEQDWLLTEARPDESLSGTVVRLKISLKANRRKSEVFQRYSLPEFDDRPGFDTTQISIHLSSSGEDAFISRSQAKRVLSDTEKFRHIELDFRNIRAVGQGFVDEVFRVFQSQNPNVKISYINASADVEFMIKRGLS